MSKSFTVAEVAQHKTEADGIYIIVDSDVYDITSESFFLRPDVPGSRCPPPGG